MAIFHFSVSVCSRGKAKSCVGASAYNSCDKIKSEYDGVLHDYSKKQNHSFHEILLCENAPKEYLNKSILWNSVEQSEKGKTAQLCRSFNFALPKELTKEEQKQLIHDFCKSNFADKGMCVQIDIHNISENPHAHVLTTMRGIDENGKWMPKRKDVYKLDENGERIPVIDKKTGQQKVDSRNRKQWQREKVDTNDWNKKETLIEWRKNWAECCNEKLRDKGVEEISHLSHQERGLKELPTIHEGYEARAMEKRGLISELCQYNREVKEYNKALQLFHEKDSFIDVLKEIEKQDFEPIDNNEKNKSLKNSAPVISGVSEPEIVVPDVVPETTLSYAEWKELTHIKSRIDKSIDEINRRSVRITELNDQLREYEESMIDIGEAEASLKYAFDNFQPPFEGVHIDSALLESKAVKLYKAELEKIQTQRRTIKAHKRLVNSNIKTQRCSREDAYNRLGDVFEPSSTKLRYNELKSLQSKLERLTRSYDKVYKPILEAQQKLEAKNTWKDYAIQPKQWENDMSKTQQQSKKKTLKDLKNLVKDVDTTKSKTVKAPTRER